jgi:hypothetical protein
LLDLQRAAGNQAVAEAFSRTGATVQRQPVPEGKDTSKLDALIDLVAKQCDAFGTYKSSPLDGASMPGASKTVQLAVSRWPGGPVEPWMGPYIAAKMGPLRLKLLTEMISMSGVGWPDYETLFPISYQNPAHDYKMELVAAKTVTEKSIAKIVPTVKISYRNTFGWHWEREYTLAAVEISAGVSFSLDGKKVKPKGGLSGGPVTLDIKGSATAAPAPLRYCGGNDFGGAVTIAKSAVSGKLGPGSAALPGLTAVTFHDTPSGDVSFAFITGLTGSVSASGSKKPSVNVSIGGGVGKAIARGETQVDAPPELREVVKATQAFREWEAVIGPFDTGSSYMPAVGDTYLDQLHKAVDTFKRQELDPIADDLRGQSVDPAKNSALKFEVAGMASRRWAAAETDAKRLKLNEDLSMKRAGAVESAVYNHFPDAVEVHKSGIGAHAVGSTKPGGGIAPMLDDDEAQALYEVKKKEALQEKDPAARRSLLQAVEANYGPASDQQAPRRVIVFCRWEGVMIMKSLAPVVSSPTGP